MIGSSTPEYIFIRACIAGLRSITPLSILYCTCLPFICSGTSLPLWIVVWPIAETAFYLLFYLPRRLILQRPAIHPYPLPRSERKELFNRAVEHIPDPERYLIKWFKDASPAEIKRENLKQFYRWAFLNTGTLDPEDDAELEGYVEKFEDRTGYKLEPGLGSAEPLTVTLDEVDMAHRPLAWYLVSKPRFTCRVLLAVEAAYNCNTDRVSCGQHHTFFDALSRL